MTSKIQLLTPAEKRLFEWVIEYMFEHTMSPAYDEIRDGLNLASKSGVHRCVHGLKDKGWVFMKDGATRGIIINKKNPWLLTNPKYAVLYEQD